MVVNGWFMAPLLDLCSLVGRRHFVRMDGLVQTGLECMEVCGWTQQNVIFPFQVKKKK